MQGLTKENFFNEMSNKYPLAHHLFLAWIDEFKLSIEYKKLFNDESLKYVAGPPLNYEKFEAPKFHHLPFEFQFGILCKFMVRCSNELSLFQFSIDFMKRRLEGTFSEIEDKIRRGKLDK